MDRNVPSPMVMESVLVPGWSDHRQRWDVIKLSKPNRERASGSHELYSCAISVSSWQHVMNVCFAFSTLLFMCRIELEIIMFATVLQFNMIVSAVHFTVRSSPYSGSFDQQHSYRPRGPTGPSNWGPRGPHSSHKSLRLSSPRTLSFSKFTVSTSKLWGYPPQQMGPRGNFGSGWEQRPPTMQGPVPHGGVYDYGVQGGHVSDHPASGPISTPVSGHAPSPSPTPAMSQSPSQANYNYGQPHGPDYGHQAPYSQAVPSQQGYGHGYDEPKSHSIQKSCCPNVPPQQQYPYASSGQSYPSNGSASGAEGNNQAMPTSSPGYPQQGSQPVPCYRQPNGQHQLAMCKVQPGLWIIPIFTTMLSRTASFKQCRLWVSRVSRSCLWHGPGATYSAPPMASRLMLSQQQLNQVMISRFLSQVHMELLQEVHQLGMGKPYLPSALTLNMTQL
ncbi:hypothetical protein GH714_012883 [Hevea brasiliensis]|uniref:Uncharacterized protein n=1 Tax=Hevea brasiliensis TaxID=3981 RepID=A0A6A6KQT8_HEVBR|nr:hypothetical protein GH714_012883 [Hevea brasiliensis]